MLFASSAPERPPARNAAFTHRCNYEKAVRLQRFAKEPLRCPTQEASHHPAGPRVHRVFQINVGANWHPISEPHQSLPEGVCIFGQEIEPRMEVRVQFAGDLLFNLPPHRDRRQRCAPLASRGLTRQVAGSDVISGAIAIGLLGGCAVGYVLSRRLVCHFQVLSERPRMIRSLGVGGGFLAALPAAFLAFVVGGNLGGRVGASSSLGSVGIALGIATGMALVLVLTVVLCAALCAGVGGVFSRRHLHT